MSPKNRYVTTHEHDEIYIDLPVTRFYADSSLPKPGKVKSQILLHDIEAGEIFTKLYITTNKPFFIDASAHYGVIPNTDEAFTEYLSDYFGHLSTVSYNPFGNVIYCEFDIFYLPYGLWKDLVAPQLIAMQHLVLSFDRNVVYYDDNYYHPSCVDLRELFVFSPVFETLMIHNTEIISIYARMPDDGSSKTPCSGYITSLLLKIPFATSSMVKNLALVHFDYILCPEFVEKLSEHFPNVENLLVDKLLWYNSYNKKMWSKLRRIMTIAECNMNAFKATYPEVQHLRYGNRDHLFGGRGRENFNSFIEAFDPEAVISTP